MSAADKLRKAAELLVAGRSELERQQLEAEVERIRVEQDKQGGKP